jgi:LCP family protein required for cell wall assembly
MSPIARQRAGSGLKPSKQHPGPASRSAGSLSRLARGWRGRLIVLLAFTLVATASTVLFYVLLVSPTPSNILILGMDRRPGEGDAVRTDTILLLRADPTHRRLAILSIPRDLWVSIPGNSEARINSAHVYGELEAPGRGPARVAATIEQNFGISVHHTLRLDFDAFRDVIDAAGGIDITVETPVIDDAYPTDDYGTMRIEIPAGQQHMDGETALQYARSRHGSSDFDRAARQQQILTALVKQVSSPQGWLTAPRVYRAFQRAVQTDMDAGDLLKLVMAWQRSAQTGLDRMVIDRTLTTPFSTADGAAVLAPRWELIHPLIQDRFLQ